MGPYPWLADRRKPPLPGDPITKLPSGGRSEPGELDAAAPDAAAATPYAIDAVRSELVRVPPTPERPSIEAAAAVVLEEDVVVVVAPRTPTEPDPAGELPAAAPAA